MKKVFAILTAFVFVGLVACGPSEAEKAAKAAADSTAMADSIAKATAEAAAAAAAAAPVDTAAADTTKK